MRKRQFLKAASGLAIGSLAGCMGYTVKRTDEVNRLQKRSEKANDLETKVQDQSEKIDELNQQIESLDNENSEQSDQIDSLESDLEDAKGKQVLYLYGYGITHNNDAIDYYDRAINSSENGNYTAARADLNVSGGYMDAAATNFTAASNRATEIGASTVRDWCESANQRTSGMVSAIADYQLAMAYYSENRMDDGDDYINRGDAHWESANEYEIKDRSTLEEELGTSIDT